jgi:hypothetical protein
LPDGQVLLQDISPASFEILLSYFYGQQDDHEKVGGLVSNSAVATFYVDAVNHGHIKLAQKALENMCEWVPLGDFVGDYHIVYQRDCADHHFREAFKKALRKIIIHKHARDPWTEQEAKRELVQIGGLRGQMVEDIISGLGDEFSLVYHPDECFIEPTSFGDQYLGNPAEDLSSPFCCPRGHPLQPAPPGFICECYAAFESFVDTRAGRLKPGWMPASPPHESGDQEWDQAPDERHLQSDAWEDDKGVACDSWDFPKHPDQDNWEPAKSASQILQESLNVSIVQHANENGWDAVRAGSNRVEVAWSNDIANDNWPIHDQDHDSWDAVNHRQVSSGNEDGWGPATHELEVAHGNEDWPAPEQDAASTPLCCLPTPDVSPVGTVQAPAPSAALGNAAEGSSPRPNPWVLPPAFQAAGIPVNPYVGHPMAMPSYVYPWGYARSQHVGNGMMHPTAPGPYGLQGKTMFAMRPSDPQYCTLIFQRGDLITNVVGYNHAAF